MPRRPLASLLWLACCCVIGLIAAPNAQAAPPLRAGEPATEEVRLRGFDVLATGGYGASTADVRDLSIEPYAGGVGLDLGYTFRSGFRTGVYFAYGVGRSVEQRHDARRWGDDFDFSVDASSVNVGLSLGYDLPLSFLVLRYSLVFGTTLMSWDLGGLPPDSVVADADSNSPASGFMLAPGLALLWPHGKLRCGIGFDYLVQTNDGIPPGFLGKLLVGVHL